MSRLRPAAAAIAAVCLAAPAPALAAKGMEVALQDDQVFVNRAYYDRDAALGHAEDLHVTRIRVNLRWATAVGASAEDRRKPDVVSYDWRRWDDLIEAAAARGIKVQLALTGDAPAWAAGNRRIGPRRPKPRLFARFARAAAEHFEGRVDRYSIWNEPNHIGWIEPKRKAPRIYRKLYKRGYRAIKRADPGAQVLFGELAPYASKPKVGMAPLRFLRRVLCVNRRYKRVRKCGRFRADGFAHHPYQYKGPPNRRFPGRDNVTMSGLRKLTRALDRLARRGILRTPQGRPLDLYLTEFGYFARGKYRMRERKRAKYVVRAFKMAARNPRVRQMLHYLLVRPNRIHSFFDTSILSRKGKPSRSYRKLRSWTAKAAKRGRIVSPVAPPPAPPPQDPPPGGPPPGDPPPQCPVPVPLVCP